MTAVKPGWKTTEFWLTVLASAVGALLASGAFEGESPVAKIVGIAAMVLSSMGYSVSRGITKKAGDSK